MRLRPTEWKSRSVEISFCIFLVFVLFSKFVSRGFTHSFRSCQVPAALEYRKSIGGEAAIREYIHNLALSAGDRLATMWGTEVMVPEHSMIGARRQIACRSLHPSHCFRSRFTTCVCTVLSFLVVSVVRGPELHGTLFILRLPSCAYTGMRVHCPILL